MLDNYLVGSERLRTPEENFELSSTSEPTVKRNLDNFLFSSLLFGLFVWLGQKHQNKTWCFAGILFIKIVYCLTTSSFPAYLNKVPSEAGSYLGFLENSKKLIFSNK